MMIADAGSPAKVSSFVRFTALVRERWLKSKSRTLTSSLAAFKVQASEYATVDLPTPPFWFRKVMTMDLNGVCGPLPCPAQIGHACGVTEIVDFAEVLSAEGEGEFHKFPSFLPMPIKKSSLFYIKMKKRRIDGSSEWWKTDPSIHRKKETMGHGSVNAGITGNKEKAEYIINRISYHCINETIVYSNKGVRKS